MIVGQRNNVVYIGDVQCPWNKRTIYLYLVLNDWPKDKGSHIEIFTKKNNKFTFFSEWFLTDILNEKIVLTVLQRIHSRNYKTNIKMNPF